MGLASSATWGVLGSALAWLVAGILFTGAIGGAPAAEATLDAALRTDLCLPATMRLDLRTVAASRNEQYTAAQAKQNAPDLVRLLACHIGKNRLLLAVEYAERPELVGATTIIYLDLDGDRSTGRQDSTFHRGVDAMIAFGGTQISVSGYNNASPKNAVRVTAARLVDKVLYLTLEAPLRIEQGRVQLDVSVLAERRGGRSDAIPRTVTFVEASDNRDLPPAPTGSVSDLRSLSDYRFHNDRVKLERLEDKGMSGASVTPSKPIVPGRPKPMPSFAAKGRVSDKAGSVARRSVPVELAEEAGVDRATATLSFGVPLPQGAVFGLEHLRLVCDDGRETPAQFAATSFWPDGSLRWVLGDAAGALKARSNVNWRVEYGNEVRAASPASPLKMTKSGDQIEIVTGPLRAVIDAKRFQLFSGLWFDRNGDGRFDNEELVARSAAAGAELIDERGRRFTMAGAPPARVDVEQQGPRKIVLRVEGPYAGDGGQTYMRYIARLVFRAGSPVVEVVFTHVNDYLVTEFTDIRSLRLPFEVPGGRAIATAVSAADAKQEMVRGGSVRLRQWDDRACMATADGAERRAARATGVARIDGAPLGIAVHDFWQRWPKGIEFADRQLSIDLLPRQPGPEYGRDLPHYLMFPFVEGLYRFKWGMSFTERLHLDCSGRASQAELAAEANLPVLAVLPAAYYAETGALGPLAPPQGQQFALWDKYVADSYRAFVARQAKDRTWGYLNYGDWYGERGRNWGNNEYDLPHGFFLQFARTGNRDYYRLALTHARHQADVDCVHAYPDPYFVGANHQHSIGHTGMWTERPSHGTWSWRYDFHTSAGNGHTWADGMVDAWCLAGDAPVMEAALGVGEHIAWAMSRDFTSLGTHERSAGWSLKAILAIYRTTADRLYLEAAERIARVALAEQKFNDGGAWPHLLPGDHSGGHAGARGNAIYLIGVLMAGLQEYHRETRDPAVLRSLQSGARWLMRSWDDRVEGWPYTAGVDGTPYFAPQTSLNDLVTGPLAYTAGQSGDAALMDIVQRAVGASVRGHADSDGKAIAQHMNFTGGALAELQKWAATQTPETAAGLLSGEGDDLAQYLSKTADASEHVVRGPRKKTFVIRLRGAEASLTATRKPYGAMNKRAEFGMARLVDSAGKVIHEEKFSTDGAHRFTQHIAGAPGATFELQVDDDLRGVWSVDAPQCQVLMRVVPGFTMGGFVRGKYHFFVPAGTTEFRIEVQAGHNGPYHAVAIAPDGGIAGIFSGQCDPAAKPSGASGSLTVRPKATDCNRPWSLVLTATGDLSLQLHGLPALLSLTANDWEPLPGQSR